MLKNRTILIVEDDTAIRQCLKEALLDEGYEVLTAKHGLDALDVLGQVEKPALIFLDLMMPVMNGYEFLKILRAGPLAAVPVIVFSANEAAEVLGANSFIKKPFELDELFRLAAQYC